MKTLIKNGRVITAVDDYTADIFVDGETVTTIGKTLDMEADVVLDASGRLVIPGGIDPHMHMELPFGGTNSSAKSLNVKASSEFLVVLGGSLSACVSQPAPCQPHHRHLLDM